MWGEWVEEEEEEEEEEVALPALPVKRSTCIRVMKRACVGGLFSFLPVLFSWFKRGVLFFSLSLSLLVSLSSVLSAAASLLFSPSSFLFLLSFFF